MPYDSIGVKESTPLSVSRSVLASDYLRISEGFFRLNRSLVFPDGINVADASELVKENAVLTSDALLYDSISYKGAIQVNALDKLVADYISYAKTYSPILFTLLTRKVKPRYLTLSISDYFIIKDSGSFIKIKSVVVSDSILYDNMAYTRTYSPILFTILSRRVKPRYLTLSILDYIQLKDSGSYIKIKVVSVSDYNIGYDYRPLAVNRSIVVNDYKMIYDKIIATKPKTLSAYDKMGYDYVPSMNPSNVHFMSIYPNPSTFSILVSDYGVFYDTATARRPYKPVVVLDVIGVKDGVSIAKRSVVAYDKIVADSVALNKV